MPPPDATGEETSYLESRRLAAEMLTVHLRDGSSVCGVLTAYDADILEITTDGGAAMVLRKSDVTMLEESAERSGRA